MRRLADIVTRHPWRVLTAWLVVAAAAILATLPGSVAEPGDVLKSEPSKFLPDRYESVRAAQLEERAFPAPDGATATVVVRRKDGRPLAAGDIDRARGLVDRLSSTAGVRAAVAPPAAVSPNHRVLLGTVSFERTQFDPLITRDVNRLRDRADAAFATTGLRVGFTGGAATRADATEREGVTSQLTMVLIFVLLLVLFRSLAVALADVLLTAIVAAIATGIVYVGAKAFDVPLSPDVTGLLPIVMLGVGTDYVVFLLSRYREHLRAGQEPHTAMRGAVERVGPAIGFSALAVAVSLSAMLLSSMSSFRTLGPSLGLGVLLTWLSALTLMPATAVLLRRAFFWPPRRRWTTAAAQPRATRAERLVSGRPVGTALAAAAVLLALAIPSLGFKANYDVEASVSGSPSEEALEDLERGFPGGALEPTEVMVASTNGAALSSSATDAVANAVRRAPGVGDVLPAVTSEDGRVARIDVLLSSPPFTKAALDTVEDHVRPVVAAATPTGTDVEVGGSTSAYADVRDAIAEDQRIIFPVAAILVGLILVVLLRSIAVPAFVMSGVALGFAATLGASVVVFDWIGGADGLTFQLPLVVYLFVASMVSDYAILILTRVRDGLRAGRSPRDAAAIAVRTAGPSVTAAGVILAASFGVLVLSPSLSQIGFAVGFGVLISALLTARLLLPSLTVIAGRRAWWPGLRSHAAAREGHGPVPSSERRAAESA